MDQDRYNKEMLMQRIEELELLTSELLLEKEEETAYSFPWTGNLGSFYFNPMTNGLIFHDQLVNALGFERGDFPGGNAYKDLLQLIEDEDLEKMRVGFSQVIAKNGQSHEMEFRIRDKLNQQKWFYMKTRIRYHEETGKPLLFSGLLFDITEKKRQEMNLSKIKEILTASSARDELTGIYNHRSILRELEKGIIESTMFRSPLSVILLDIDDFKSVNELHGREEGNRILRQVVHLMEDTLRVNDVAGRTGADEFLIVLPQTVQNDARIVAERIRKKISEAKLIQGMILSVSAGYVQRKSEDEKAIIEEAKRKLHDAKAMGRNPVSP